jgi:hypothetical protein
VTRAPAIQSENGDVLRHAIRKRPVLPPSWAIDGVECVPALERMVRPRTLTDPVVPGVHVVGGRFCQTSVRVPTLWVLNGGVED